MKAGTIVATYFVVWWITLFLVLPFGIKNAHETGDQVREGHDAGAPMAAQLLIKAAINTVIAAVVTAAIVWAVRSGIFAD